MSTNFIVTFVDLFVGVFTFLILVRVILSYIVSPSNRLFGWVAAVTEPLLAPLRKILPSAGGLDLSPILAYVLLRVIQALVHRLVA